MVHEAEVVECGFIFIPERRLPKAGLGCRGPLKKIETSMGCFT